MVIIEERLDRGYAMRGQVVDDAVKLKMRSDVGIETGQELNEVRCAPRSCRLRVHRPVTTVERREQRCGAVTAILELLQHR